MKTGKELLTKKYAENYPKPGKAIPIPLPTEVLQNCPDSTQEVETKEDKRIQGNARQTARCPKAGTV